MGIALVGSVAVIVPRLSGDQGDALVADGDDRTEIVTETPAPSVDDESPRLTGSGPDPTSVELCLVDGDCRTLADTSQATWLRDAMSTATAAGSAVGYCRARGPEYDVSFRHPSARAVAIRVRTTCGPTSASGRDWLLDPVVISRVVRAFELGEVDPPAFPRGAITLDVCTGDTEQFCPVPGSQAERDRLAVLLSAGGLQRTGSGCGEIRQDLATITATYPGGEEVTAKVGAICGPLRTGSGDDYLVLDSVRREHLQRVEVDDPGVVSSPTPSALAEGTVGCDWTDAKGTETPRDVGRPSTVAPERDRTATLVTNRGEIGLTLTGTATPCTVHSFVHLASNGYYDDTRCHRLTTEGIFVVQCGDPRATGVGGPGYAFADEDLRGATYPRGTLAMANAGAGTNGSQFFMVYRDMELPPSYTVFGRVDETGLRVLEEVAAGGAEPEGDGTPTLPLTITGVRLS